MKNKRETRTCKTHGETEFRLERRSVKENRREVYRCVKCASISVQKRRDKLKELAIEYKGGCCQKCGYNKCLGALEFHHLDPNEKDFGIAEKGITRSFEKLKVELDKCILVCANCHREMHEELRFRDSSVGRASSLVRRQATFKRKPEKLCVVGSNPTLGAKE